MPHPFLHTASVPVFKQMLEGLSALLTKAQVHAEAKGIDPQALLQARLFPDMFALHRQVQVAADFAQSISARLADAPVPAPCAIEADFAHLQACLAQAVEFIEALDAADFKSSAEREVVLRPGTPKEKRLSGTAYLLNYGLPQFFFHVTTAYALLRHNGVDVGKKDYMGAY
jgi:uncharacterized protein